MRDAKRRVGDGEQRLCGSCCRERCSREPRFGPEQLLSESLLLRQDEFFLSLKADITRAGDRRFRRECRELLLLAHLVSPVGHEHLETLHQVTRNNFHLTQTRQTSVMLVYTQGKGGEATQHRQTQNTSSANKQPQRPRAPGCPSPPHARAVLFLLSYGSFCDVSPNVCTAHRIATRIESASCIPHASSTLRNLDRRACAIPFAS